MIDWNFFKKPIVAALLGLTLGLIIGLVVLGWGLWPVVWKDAAPVHLRQDFQVDYLRMTIDSYRIDQNDALAIQRYKALGDWGPARLQEIEIKPGNQDVNTIQQFKEIVQAEALISTPMPDNGITTNKTASLTRILIIGGALLLFALVGTGIFRYLIPIFRNTKITDQNTGNRAQDITSQTEITNYESMGEEPPISQFVTTYVIGDDLFDDSFSIDAPSGEFLGECGIGISEAIGVGEPKKVAAFEIWLFDKNDIQTITKVLMSTHSFNDVATHQRLQAKGEPFMADKGKQVVLETAALQLVATISDMEYGQGALPQDSYFERLTLEIAVWPKVAPPA
jgi:hypothetical protein